MPDLALIRLTAAQQQIEEAELRYGNAIHDLAHEQARTEAAEAKIEELTRELDDWHRVANDHQQATFREQDRAKAAEAQRDTLREGIEEHRRYSTRDGREPDKAAHEDVRLYELLSTPPDN